MIKRKIKLAYSKLRREVERDNTALLLLGREMSWRVSTLPLNTDFRKLGFKVFSQSDEDGIIQYLINVLPIANRTFIEFGVESYEESNTRFLLMNDNWQGMILDGSPQNIKYVQSDKIYWQYDLQAKCAWITRENVQLLLRGAGFPEDLGLLSIDVDGNEYWIWEAIQSIKPRVVIIEYNSVFGRLPITIPYQENFNRTVAHYSNLYFGCSLAALDHLAKKKGYILVGSSAWGQNAFFLRSDVAGQFRRLDPQEAYVASKFRESRDRAGNLSYVRAENRIKLIEHLPVRNVVTGLVGQLKDCYEAS